MHRPYIYRAIGTTNHSVRAFCLDNPKFDRRVCSNIGRAPVAEAIAGLLQLAVAVRATGFPPGLLAAIIAEELKHRDR